MAKYYLLKDREVIPCVSMEAWAKEMQDIDTRRVGSTYIGDVHISTVFLGINHNFDPATSDLEPLLFETMVFGASAFDLLQYRCSTYAEAEKQHERVVAEVNNALDTVKNVTSKAKNNKDPRFGSWS